MVKRVIIFALAASALLPPALSEEVVTNGVGSSWADEVQRRLHGSVSVDYRTGFAYRGIILSNGSSAMQEADLRLDGGVCGYFGGRMFSASSLDMTGCPLADRRWYFLAAYNCYYGYDFRLADDWVLDAQAFRNWMVFHGCVDDPPTVAHWGGILALKNQYVVPFCILRSTGEDQKWTYWGLGLRRRFRPLDRLTLMPVVLFDLGDSGHLYTMYGPNPNRYDGRYSSGLMSTTLALHADYALTDWLSLTAFLQQYVAMNGDGRDALDANNNKSTVKELTIFGVGVRLKF